VLAGATPLCDAEHPGQIIMSGLPSNHTLTAERRATDRRPLRVAIRVQRAGCAAVELRSFDIGPDGIGFIAPGHAATGTRFAVRLALPQKGGVATPVLAEVEVVYAVFSRSDDGIRIGTRFSQIDAAAQQAVNAYLASR
jgi:hypothetical protein